MPYEVVRSDSCPMSRPWGVRKQGTTEVMGCHPTRERAMRQMRALYANEAMPMTGTMKASRLGEGHWRICAIPFGGPLKGGRDLDGEYFSPRTDVKADWFPERPVIFHHGADRRLKDAQVGREGPLSKEADGWWAEMWLDVQSDYFEQLEALIAAGKVYGSSGAIAHLVRKAADGEILTWPHAEQTLTLTPANVFARITAAKALVDYDTAGIASKAVRLLADLDSLTRDLGAAYESGTGPASEERIADSLDFFEGHLADLRAALASR